MEQIRTYFEQMVAMSDADWSMFASKLQKQEFPKKSNILDKGKIEQYLSFIGVGSTRLYIPKIENDLTFGFCFKNEFVTAYDSFITQEPSSYTIEAITDTILWRISHQELQEVYAKTNIGNTIGRLAAENLFLKKAERELAFLNQTAEERYVSLYKKRPNVIKEIPLRHIASYIGITPQALSRIRARIS